MIGKNATASPSGLRLAGLSRKFGDVYAARDVDLTIERGEFLTLLGPSGSGKTTLLMMIAGFLEPTAGDLLLDGTIITRLPAEKRNFGMVFQGYALFPHLNVSRNIAYSLEVRKIPQPEIDARVREMLALVQLESFGDRLPKQLSGGQQQRVALARALAFKPQLLLLDEPLGALDRKLRTEVQSQLKHIHHRIGTTFIYVTHDQEEALSMSDRIAIMNEGRILQLGTPQELYERPSTMFAAGFLGESNFLRGRITSRQDDVITYAMAGSTFNQSCPRAEPSIGDDIVLALRPEKIDIDTPTANQGDNCLIGRVTDLSYFGAKLTITTEVDNVGTLRVEVNVWRNTHQFALGREIGLNWSREAAVIVLDDRDG